MENKNKKEKKYPEPVVGALIVNKNGEILLAKSKKWVDQYTIVGGHVELGESMEEAVRREVIEEAGIAVEVVDQLGFSDSLYDKGFHDKKHFIFIDFLCRYDGKDDAIKLNGEFFPDDFKWVLPEKAFELDIPEGTRRIISEYLKYLEREKALDNWKRSVADFENYKKRQLESRKELLAYANQELIMEILPVVDNFHASTDHVPEDKKDNSWVVGIMHIQKQLEKVLEDNGVLEIPVKVGDEFDPKIHEAISDANLPASPAGGRMESESTNKKDKKKETKNIIHKVVQKGYCIGERVMRAARVIVE